MMHEDELRTLLAERSAGGPEPAARRASVNRKVSAIRRRRVAALACAAAVLTGAALAAPAVLAHRPDNSPSVPIRHSDLPEYFEGGRMIGQVTLRLPAGEATFRIAHPSAEVFFGVRCGDRDIPIVELLVNGYRLARFVCHNDAYSPLSPIPMSLSDRRHFRLRPGTPLTITVRVPRPTGSGRIRAGAWDPVPPDQYPAAPRPKGPIEPATQNPYQNDVQPLFTVRAEPDRYVTTVSHTVTLTDDLTLLVGIGSPGTLRVSVDGTEVKVFRHWDYTWTAFDGNLMAAIRDAGLRTPKGQQITLTVRSEYFTDPGWQVDVGPFGPPYIGN
jgi:hypothetical protein